MSKYVEISECNFNKSKIDIGRGKHIRFKSTDGKTYTVDCGTSDPDISDDFPFTVPGDNKNHKLKIKDKAVKKSYDCHITAGCSDDPRKNVERPKMIIKVE